MNKKCKCCESQNRDFIDSELRAGVTFRKLSDALKALGEGISRETISKHDKECLGSASRQQIELINGIHPRQAAGKSKYQGKLEIVTVSIPDGDMSDEDHMEFIRQGLNESFRMQIATVLEHQRRFMRGESLQHRDEIKALESLARVISNQKFKISTKKRGEAETKTTDEILEDLTGLDDSEMIQFYMDTIRLDRMEGN